MSSQSSNADSDDDVVMDESSSSRHSRRSMPPIMRQTRMTAYFPKETQVTRADHSNSTVSRNLVENVAARIKAAVPNDDDVWDMRDMASSSGHHRQHRNQISGGGSDLEKLDALLLPQGQDGPKIRPRINQKQKSFADVIAKIKPKSAAAAKSIRMPAKVLDAASISQKNPGLSPAEAEQRMLERIRAKRKKSSK